MPDTEPELVEEQPNAALKVYAMVYVSVAVGLTVTDEPVPTVFPRLSVQVISYNDEGNTVLKTTSLLDKQKPFGVITGCGAINGSLFKLIVCCVKPQEVDTLII